MFRKECGEYCSSMSIKWNGNIPWNIMQVHYFNGEIFAHAQEKAAIWWPLNLSHILRVEIVEFMHYVHTRKLTLAFRSLVRSHFFTNRYYNELGIRWKLHCSDGWMEVIVCYNFLSLQRYNDSIAILWVEIPLSTAMRSSEFGAMQMEVMLLRDSGGRVYVQLLHKSLLL